MTYSILVVDDDEVIKNCVEDAVNTVNWLSNEESLQVDPNNIVLFVHSLGGFICLKAIQQLPNVKKGFALSTWDFFGEYKDLSTRDEIMEDLKSWNGDNYFVLNTPARDIFELRVFARGSAIDFQLSFLC